MDPSADRSSRFEPERDIVLLKSLGDGRYAVLDEEFASADEAGRHLTRELVKAYFPEWLPRPEEETADALVAAAGRPDAGETPPQAAAFGTSDGATVRLRTARAADAAQVAQLANDLDREVGDASVPHSAETVARDMLGGKAGLVLWVVEPATGGGPVGYALVQDMYDTDGALWATWLHDLYVNPDWRNCDVGEALMAHLARTAQARGHGGLWWGVHRKNWKAERFYRRLGAHRAPIHVMGVAGPTLAALAAKAP